MQIQKTNFDEFEKNIDNEFHKLDNIPSGKGNKWWTKEVKNAVRKVSKEREREYKIYASGCDQADGREWLYDLTCLEEEGDYLKGIPLVLESEWKNTKKNYEEYGIRYDFKKLLVSRADHRVMVLEAESDEKGKDIINQLLQHVQKCRHSMVGDRYLFACWSKAKGVFDCSVYVVKE